MSQLTEQYKGLAIGRSLIIGSVCTLEIMRGLMLCVIACLLVAANADLILTTCARMNDGFIGKKVADTACMMSCNTKNCGGSECVFRSGRAVCTCNRCANGAGSYPPFG